MKQFHVHVLVSKKSAYDYVKALCQLSNNAAPTTVAVKISKFKNTVITGVVAVQCSRHRFCMPQGMVDLTKGEG
jgi:hypothetical protein